MSRSPSSNATIKSIHARQILDSRGIPTLEAEVELDDGIIGRAAVPSGASVGSREAIELRDGNAALYNGKGVTSAMASVTGEIAQKLRGRDATDQRKIDALMIELDGTQNFARLGANAVLSVSLATARAASQSVGAPLWRYLGDLSFPKGSQFLLPLPLVNIINGGAHANNLLDFQEFMIAPTGAPTFSEAVRYSAEVFHALKSRLGSAGHSTGVGDEGGFAPALTDAEEALELIVAAIADAGLSHERDVTLALDCAASEFFRDGSYHLDGQNKVLSSSQLIDYLEKLQNSYSIISIEDGLAEDDWSGWQELTRRLGANTQLVGDDLFTTSETSIRRGSDIGAGNSVLIKLNQNGSLSGTLDAISQARRSGFSSIISHRSGETEDSFIADFAVGTSTGQIKTGSMSRSERLAKYNQLLRIEAQLGENATYAGSSTVSGIANSN